MVRAGEVYQHEKPGGALVDERADITRLSLQQVGQLHQYFTSMHAYVLQELAKADQILTVQEYVHDTFHKQLTLRLDEGQAKYKLEAQIAQNKEAAVLYQHVLEARAHKDMLSAITRGLEAKAALASREISRRGAEK